MNTDTANKYLFENLIKFFDVDTSNTLIGYLSSMDQENMSSYLKEFSGGDGFSSVVTRYFEIISGNPVATREKMDSPLNRALGETTAAIQKVELSDKNVISTLNYEKSTDFKSPPKKNDKKYRNKNVGKTSTIITRLCGCMATEHRFITSCHGCGRIICEMEGLGCCKSCGVCLIEPMNASTAAESGMDNSTVLAYKQKDKLLRFDQENTRRTHVNDAQADYYSNSTWLSAEEKSAIDEKESQRLEGYKKAGKSITFRLDLENGEMVKDVDNFSGSLSNVALANAVVTSGTGDASAACGGIAAVYVGLRESNDRNLWASTSSKTVSGISLPNVSVKTKAEPTTIACNGDGPMENQHVSKKGNGRRDQR